MDEFHVTAGAAVAAAATAAAITINQLHTTKSFITVKMIIKNLLTIKNNI
jgi:hypothetical protein|tara:strand:+ start:72 stop:221 length:150 start_codon:yes stop_codon:yes gene_type:complete